MFLIFLALIASQKPLRDTTFIKTGNDTLWITGNKIWNSTGTITIEGALSVGKVDSAAYADSSGWADLLDGYNEDYFRDTNDVWRDSIHAYQEAIDSLATPKIKTDFVSPNDSTNIGFPAGNWYVDNLTPATNDSFSSKLGSVNNPYGEMYSAFLYSFFTRNDTTELRINSGGYAEIYIDTVGTDSIIVEIGATRRGVAIE